MFNKVHEKSEYMDHSILNRNGKYETMETCCETSFFNMNYNIRHCLTLCCAQTCVILAPLHIPLLLLLLLHHAMLAD